MQTRLSLTCGKPISSASPNLTSEQRAISPSAPSYQPLCLCLSVTTRTPARGSVQNVTYPHASPLALIRSAFFCVSTHFLLCTFGPMRTSKHARTWKACGFADSGELQRRCTTERQAPRLGIASGYMAPCIQMQETKKVQANRASSSSRRLDFFCTATSVFTWRGAEFDTCTISSIPENMKRISHSCSDCSPLQTPDHRIAGLSYLHGYSGVSTGDIALLSISATFDAARPLLKVALATQTPRNSFTTRIRSVGALSPAVHRGRQSACRCVPRSSLPCGAQAQRPRVGWTILVGCSSCST